MLPDYYYHIFISYSRLGDVPGWVHTHFLPVLTNRMDAVWNESPQIFIDQKIDVGSDWPEDLANALHHSCCMLAIWSPSFFRSKWCMAEWETMLAREQQTGLRSRGHTMGLVYPVVFSDGEYFPEAAKRTQSKFDLKDYTYPYPQFRNTPEYLKFHDKMTEVANGLVRLLQEVPPWNAAWTVVRPPPNTLDEPRFKRL